MELKNAFQHKNEWNQLIQAIGNIDSFIEIGTCHGGTFEYLAEIAQGIKISIDLATGDFGGIGEAKAKGRNDRIQSKFDNCHFINRDSKDFETVKQVENILKGKQVDFLFIDGDHTFEGVQADFMIYRQFVKQGGFIAFHDIIESKFHTAANCFVSKFWAKLKHVGHEYISKDNSDVTDNARGIGNNKFGGIGLIKNDFKESTIHIFKPIHSQESLNLCLKNCGNNIPILVYNDNTIFFENAVIRKVYETYSFDSKD